MKTCVSSIIAVGRELIQAREKYDYGELSDLYRLLPFTRRSAQRYMLIARSERLSDTTQHVVFPSSVSTLYEIVTLSDDDYSEALQCKLISASTTCRDIAVFKNRNRPKPERVSHFENFRAMTIYINKYNDDAWKKVCNLLDELEACDCIRVDDNDLKQKKQRKKEEDAASIASYCLFKYQYPFKNKLWKVKKKLAQLNKQIKQMRGIQRMLREQTQEENISLNSDTLATLRDLHLLLDEKEKLSREKQQLENNLNFQSKFGATKKEIIETMTPFEICKMFDSLDDLNCIDNAESIFVNIFSERIRYDDSTPIPADINQRRKDEFYEHAWHSDEIKNSTAVNLADFIA